MGNLNLVAIAVGLAALSATVPLSFAAPVPSFVPAECQKYVDQPSEDHELKILTPGPYVPGGTIDVQAATTDSGTGTNRVRIVAIIDGTNTIYDNVQSIPGNFGSVSDTITIPADTPKGSSLDIYACFESPSNVDAEGVTHHLDVGSFFVIPESGIGAIALVGASLAGLGGFAALRSFGKGIA